MLNALIVDDEAPARLELRFLLEETGRIKDIFEASNAREAVEILVHGRETGKSKIDIIFLDISMPKMSGMQLADALHKLKNPPAIIFVTAYSEYALNAFEVDAVDYLMKPVETDRLLRALDKAQIYLKPQVPTKPAPERLPVEKSGRKILIPVREICYIEAKDDYSCIYTDDDKFLSTVSLVRLEQRLDSMGFIRVHRGFIVNIDKVEGIDPIVNGVMTLRITNIPDVHIPVSRRRSTAIKRILGL